MNDEEKERARTEFNKGSREEKRGYLNSINDQLFSLIHAEFGTLPVISAISATLLIVATFNKNLLPLTGATKTIISILIAIVPLSLAAYIMRLREAKKMARELYDAIGATPLSVQKPFWSRALDEAPVIFAAILFVTVVVIICYIWAYS